MFGLEAGGFAQVVDQEQADLEILGKQVEETEDRTHIFDVVLALAGDAGEGIDDDQLGVEGEDHLDQAIAVLLPGEIEHVERITSGMGEHEVEAGGVHLPGLGTLVDELGDGFGVDVNDDLTHRPLSMGWRGESRGKGEAVDKAAGEVEGEEGLTGTGDGAEEGDHTAGDPARPQPLDRLEGFGQLEQAGVAAQGGAGEGGKDETHDELTVGEVFEGVE